jgi:hypothetical protein
VGKYLSVWGVKAIFPAGFIIDGGTFILFGLLQWVDDITTFLVFSYIIRFIEVNKRHDRECSVYKSVVQILPLKAGNKIKGSAKMLRISLFANFSGLECDSNSFFLCPLKIFERCLNSNPECCRCQRTRYQLSPPSLKPTQPSAFLPIKPYSPT